MSTVYQGYYKIYQGREKNTQEPFPNCTAVLSPSC